MATEESEEEKNTKKRRSKRGTKEDKYNENSTRNKRRKEKEDEILTPKDCDKVINILNEVVIIVDEAQKQDPSQTHEHVTKEPYERNQPGQSKKQMAIVLRNVADFVRAFFGL